MSLQLLATSSTTAIEMPSVSTLRNLKASLVFATKASPGRLSCEQSTVSCTQVNNCDSHATCLYDESLGKSKCVCNPGYQGDGFNCTITGCSSSSALRHFTDAFPQQSARPTATARRLKSVFTPVRNGTSACARKGTSETRRINASSLVPAAAAAALRTQNVSTTTITSFIIAPAKAATWGTA
jgi:hypothetical protein